MARAFFWLFILCLLAGAPSVAGLMFCAMLLSGIVWLLLGPTPRFPWL